MLKMSGCDVVCRCCSWAGYKGIQQWVCLTVWASQDANSIQGSEPFVVAMHPLNLLIRLKHINTSKPVA